MTAWLGHHRIRQAAQVLRQGGVIAYPTESVWGLGADPANPRAIARLLDLKHRPRDKGLILIAASLAQVEPWLVSLPSDLRAQLEASWPGPNTWLVPNCAIASPWVTGNHTSVALRVTDHPVAKALCLAFGGPLISTSANPQKRPAAKTAVEVRRYFGRKLDFIAPGQTSGRRQPSQIRDLLTGRILRGG
ncbi:L-threonylcarbamoyladenylate synthase [Gilvimarinus sp. SDUM040013]|uniref:Threonylcarbamoyl-AMP synthase n=1 Tax=Gilvimarinus gilvus TaxID=3058038 RepID=A0ABU4RVE4_9GAMM|nr:L-threonylcarbamoyladenylate synthase [Gilvimarinus sp. SDUM040013]MDO3387723.1 L-threonylcarbamoyladenylate synthase [Gilvimarinus sp. SDUM040013]MDX6848836.1 L-threonylcarbamoyladenylate synthase [Gilvimarinus sp. SDUM040013]